MAETPVSSKPRVVALIPEVAGMVGPAYRFFADRGVRETIESIIVAVLLALLFRGFEGEAFIIPTGSMAPGLMGQHVDQWCQKCGVEYKSGASEENSTIRRQDRNPVVRTYCPVCGFCTALTPNTNADHVSNQGDRILVNKYIYDFQEPERFDVIVFKNPNNGKQNLIKRLVGLPNESLTISRGDIYILTPDGQEGWYRKIARKPPDKQLAMLQLVDDTGHRADEIVAAGWPENWAADPGENWTTTHEDGGNRFSVEAGAAGQPVWLRYRHVRPTAAEWETDVKAGAVPAWVSQFKGRLIGDYYGYNDFGLKWTRTRQGLENRPDDHPSPANHWVGDLAVEATVHPRSKSGALLLDLVEGGVHFTCRIDLANGRASFSCDDPAINFCNEAGDRGEPPAGLATPVDDRGYWTVTFANADNRLLLWVNGKLIESPGSCYSREEKIYPRFSADDPGDAQPCGIAGEGVALDISRLRVLRDVYYVAARGLMQSVTNETGFPGMGDGGPNNRRRPELIQRIHSTPELWDTTEGRALFDASLRTGAPMFTQGPGQYFPLGDNSPESKDARIWEGPNWFSRELLIGRAMLVYWPHVRNHPVPYTPNFQQMRPIR